MNELIKISEEPVVTVQAISNITTVSATIDGSTSVFEINGISIVPQFSEIKPNDIRNSIIRKEQAEGGIFEIEKFTTKGIYIVNIKDYSSDEIQFLSQRITDKLLSEIWTLLTTLDTNQLIISLSDEKIKEHILKENRKLFKTENEFEIFCSKYGLTLKSFVESAKFSELDIKLKEIEARFDLEQFYARRFLFCSMLTDRLRKRISDYILNGNQIEHERLNLIDIWIERMNQQLEVLKNFKDYHKLYDMPQQDNKIEIKNSKNVIIGNDLSNSKFSQKISKESKSESKFSKKIGVWTLIIMTIGIVVTIIINWDKIF